MNSRCTGGRSGNDRRFRVGSILGDTLGNGGENGGGDSDGRDDGGRCGDDNCEGSVKC